MEVKTFKETYHNPVKQINVPTPFQMGNFDVIFMQKIPEKMNNLSQNARLTHYSKARLKSLMIKHHLGINYEQEYINSK